MKSWFANFYFVESSELEPEKAAKKHFGESQGRDARRQSLYQTLKVPFRWRTEVTRGGTWLETSSGRQQGVAGVGAATGYSWPWTGPCRSQMLGSYTRPMKMGNLCCWSQSRKRKGCCTSKTIKERATETAEAAAASTPASVSSNAAWCCIAET